jgi:hypothetical protein
METGERKGKRQAWRGHGSTEGQPLLLLLRCVRPVVIRPARAGWMPNLKPPSDEHGGRRRRKEMERGSGRANRHGWMWQLACHLSQVAQLLWAIEAGTVALISSGALESNSHASLPSEVGTAQPDKGT